MNKTKVQIIIDDRTSEVYYFTESDLKNLNNVLNLITVRNSADRVLGQVGDLTGEKK